MKNKFRNMKRKSAGFTLLELVVVVAVMGLISTMAMDVYTDHSNQKRFEATKERLAEIKFAIIGDPMMKVGSQTVLSGFYYDTERLPFNINELIIDPDNVGECFDISSAVTIESKKSDCEVIIGNTWHSDWNGPYLHNLQSNKGDLVFRDAWGNTNSDGNFGWIFTPNGDDLVVQTKGLNREIVDTEYSTQYELNYPSSGNLINKVELETIRRLKGIASDKVYLSAVNTKVLTNNKDYCLAIKSGSNIYISETQTINLEQNQPKTLSFSNFKNNSTGLIILSLPNGNYTYKFYEDSVSTPCPVAGSSPTTDASKALYIKQNGNFATLKIFS